MADKTSSAPYFAETRVIHRNPPFRVQDFLDFVAVIAGSGWHVSTVDGEPRLRRLKAGDMIVYRPGDEIRLRGTPADGITLRYVSSPIAEWRMFASMVGVDPAWAASGEPPVSTFDLGDEEVIGAFDLAIERFRRGATSLDLVQFWIDVIPTMFPASHRRFAGFGAPSWLLDSVEAMRDEGNLRAGLPRLLELTHVSASHVSATTRRYFDRTPTELIATLRLRHAAYLLATTTNTVSEISRRCGFSRIAYFSTSFRREHGLTPSEYRARAATRSLFLDR